MEEQNSMTENKRETKLGVKTKLVITNRRFFWTGTVSSSSVY